MKFDADILLLFQQLLGDVQLKVMHPAFEKNAEVCSRAKTQLLDAIGEGTQAGTDGADKGEG